MSDDTNRAAAGEAGLARRSTSGRRWLVFAVIALASVCGAAGYTWHVLFRAKAAEDAQGPVRFTKTESLPSLASAPEAGLPQPSSADSAAAAAVTWGERSIALQRPLVLFRSTALGESHGRIGAAYLDDMSGERFLSPLQCERVHFARGRGICLQAQRGALTTYHAHVFDQQFKVTHSFALAGAPSRARMSPDGKLAAMTVFVTGHSYGSAGFVTRTSVIDAASGRMLAEDLERFEVEHEGKVIKENDFNFWGVSFTNDGRRFYATLGTAGKTLLVEGDLGARRMRVLRDDVECPSLSPDNRRVAFKRRHPGSSGGRIAWGLHVLDLESGKETALRAEQRNVDDQVEWLSNAELVYGMPDDNPNAPVATHVWAMAADGTSAPRLFLSLAWSPAVIAAKP